MKCRHVTYSKCSRNGERIFSRPARENYGNSWLTKEKSLWEHLLVVTTVISTRLIIFISTSQITNSGFVFVTWWCSYFSKAMVRLYYYVLSVALTHSQAALKFFLIQSVKIETLMLNSSSVAHIQSFKYHQKNQFCFY